MTGDRTPHITVTYRNGRAEITSVYTVNEEISRELDRHIKKPGGEDLQAWLEKKGCQLDSSGGPALVWRFASGTTEEMYYREGRLHREDGPALVWCYANGSTMEQYYRNGELHREDGPAVVKRYANGSNYEEYYRDGKKHREDGPAYVWHSANGSTEEKILSR